ncbi:MAG TPA: hypothetical protein PLS44_03175, partial [Candidatus Cloacimonas sp.]|nr:hypothetical protein [Candidatus Cloacimonas sp.]
IFNIQFNLFCSISLCKKIYFAILPPLYFALKKLLTVTASPKNKHHLKTGVINAKGDKNNNSVFVLDFCLVNSGGNDISYSLSK